MKELIKSYRDFFIECKQTLKLSADLFTFTKNKILFFVWCNKNWETVFLKKNLN